VWGGGLGGEGVFINKESKVKAIISQSKEIGEKSLSSLLIDFCNGNFSMAFCVFLP
jgi:hypothetical protein